MSRRRPFLIGASASLLALAAVQLATPPVYEPPPASILAPRRPLLVEASPPRDLGAILARPLFSPSRRSAATADDEDRLAGATVLGIGTADGAATALLRIADGSALRVLPGQQVGAWRIDRILPDRIDLSRGQDRLILPLETSPSAPPAAGDEGQP